MVPASTLMYGSIFCSVTRSPRDSRSEPIEAAASPLPREDTTPPVTKMNFALTLTPPFDRDGCRIRMPEPHPQVLVLLTHGLHAAVEPPASEVPEIPPDRGTARDAEGDEVLSGQ